MKSTKLFLKLAMAVALSAAAGIGARAADGLKIEHLGVNNTLVRITGDAPYLMLPIQEGNADARINVLVDGKVEKTFYARLASSKTNYTVPFDLRPFGGKNVMLDIVTPQGRSSMREAKEDVCWRRMTLADTIDLTDHETHYRPLYHHTPLYGWMNDPNGMFYKDGTWHLYYQYNPYGSKWQNMTWGHSTSPDLIHWTPQPLAIEPNGLGSIFSGSAVIDSDNTAGFGKDAVIAMFTSAGTSQMQSIAASNNGGISFDIYTGNPVLTLESEARDPKLFWNEKTGQWNMVLAHALEHEILFFSSPDLKTWTLLDKFGKGEAAQGGVWECPDLFELKTTDTDGNEISKWVLLCNINPGGPFGGSATQYFVGDWDGKTFVCDTDANGKIATKWLDYGKDHYATVSWFNAPDNRRTLLGWMSNWQYAAEVPTRQFRSANTLPRDAGLFLGPDGQYYVSSAPAPELDALRGKTVSHAAGRNITERPLTFALPNDGSGACEIVIDFDALEADSVTISLANKISDHVDITYNPADRTLTFNRCNSGVVEFSEEFPEISAAPTFETDGHIKLRIFVDRSSIEVFGNDGRFVLTNLVFPKEYYNKLTVAAYGGKARLTDLNVYSLDIK